MRQQREVPIGELFAFVLEHRDDGSAMLEQAHVVGGDGNTYVMMLSPILLMAVPWYTEIVRLADRHARGKDGTAAATAVRALEDARALKGRPGEVAAMVEGLEALGTAQLGRITDLPAYWLSTVESKSEAQSRPDNVVELGLRAWRLFAGPPVVGRRLTFTFSWEERADERP